MESLIRIASGWISYLRASPATRSRIERRIAICEKCPHRQEVDRVTGRILKLIGNDPNNLYRCGLCKCPLAGLASLETPACKAGKWKS